jgi:hypothetical protein
MFSFKDMIGLPQRAHTRLLGGFIVVAGGYVIIRGLSKFLGYAGIAPYPESEISRVKKALQRFATDSTKTLVEVHFYPLDSLRILKPRRSNENGHALSGAIRDAARRLIDEAIQTAGGTKYELNPSTQSKATHRNHYHYAVGDLALDHRHDIPTGTSFIVGIDVDYYITEPEVVLQYMCPVVLHTFNPVKVSGLDADTPFTISDNVVDYRVSGGANWQHRVWDWCESGEFVSSRVYLNWWQWIKTLPLRLIGMEKVGYHKIHHCRPWIDCPDRALVYTTPQYTLWRFKWLPHEITVRQLKHITYQDTNKPGWNRLTHITHDNKLMVSIGREGEHLSVTIPKEHLEMLSGLTASQSVTAKLISLGYFDPVFTSMILQYFTGKKVNQSISPTIYKSIMPRVHWPVTSEADVPDISARQYTRPILSDSMLVPMIRRWETMSESIERRVTFVVNKKLPSNGIADMIDKFVTTLNRNIRNIHPLSIEETIDRLDKPSQQLQLKQVFETLDVTPRALIDAFNKNEPGMKSSRIISGFADIRFILQVSRYTLAYTDLVLKNEHNAHWYYPGRTPQEIADGICDFVADCDGEVVETDFSNLDGRVSDWMQRNIAQRAMIQAFAPEYRDEIRSIMSKIIDCPAQAKRFGFRYEPGPGVKSGSPTTTAHNTIYNAAVEFIALNISIPTATSEELFRLIGPKCGDDGVSRAIIQKSINKAASSLGLEVKVERYNPEVGLCFLARVFVDPLTTNTTMQDPLRTLRKLHITMRDPTIPLPDAACDRVDGYLCTDSLTPLISDYCRMIIRLYEPIASTKEVRLKRKSRNKEKPYWLTCDGSWPQDPNCKELMLTVMSQRTGLDLDQIAKLTDKFATMQDPWDLITLDTGDDTAQHTITEEGVAPGSVDGSFTKLQHAKQTRANPTAAKSRKRSTSTSVGIEVQGCPNQRSKGFKQPFGVPGKNKAKSKSGDGGTVDQTNSTGLSGRKTTTYNRGNKSRGKNSQPRTQNQTGKL